MDRPITVPSSPGRPTNDNAAPPQPRARESLGAWWWLGPGSQRSTPPHLAALPAQSPTGRRSVSRLRRCKTRTRQGWFKDGLVPCKLLAVCTYRLYLLEGLVFFGDLKGTGFLDWNVLEARTCLKVETQFAGQRFRPNL